MSQKKKNPYLYCIEIVLIFIALSTLLLAHLSAFIYPHKLWILSIFGLFFFPIFIFNILVLIFSLVRRNKLAIVLIVCMLASASTVLKYVNVSDKKLYTQADIKILSYNVGRFSLSSLGLSAKENVQKIVAWIKEQRADIVCLQEFRMIDSQSIESFVHKNFPGYYFAYYIFPSSQGAYGNLSLSRFPIGDKGTFKFEESSNIVLYTDCITKAGKFRIYNCHLQSYSIAVSKLPLAMFRNYSFTVKKTEGKLKKAIKKRQLQVEKVLKDIKASPYKSFIVGDFNDGPLSYTYRRLSEYQSDSFQDAGSFFSATYSIGYPMLRVDHILYPSVCEAISHKVSRLPYSDHYPILASFNIK